MWLLLFKMGPKTTRPSNTDPTSIQGVAQTATAFVGTNLATVIADVAAATVAAAPATAIVADLVAVVTDTGSVTAAVPTY